MTILFAALWVSCWLHTSGVMQDRCAHLLLTLQQCPLFVESECDVHSVYMRELLLTCLSSRKSSSWVTFSIAFTVLATLDCEVPSLIHKWQLVPS